MWSSLKHVAECLKTFSKPIYLCNFNDNKSVILKYIEKLGQNYEQFYQLINEYTFLMKDTTSKLKTGFERLNKKIIDITDISIQTALNTYTGIFEYMYQSQNDIFDYLATSHTAFIQIFIKSYKKRLNKLYEELEKSEELKYRTYTYVNTSKRESKPTNSEKYGIYKSSEACYHTAEVYQLGEDRSITITNSLIQFCNEYLKNNKILGKEIKTLKKKLETEDITKVYSDQLNVQTFKLKAINDFGKLTAYPVEMLIKKEKNEKKNHHTPEENSIVTYTESVFKEEKGRNYVTDKNMLLFKFYPLLCTKERLNKAKRMKMLLEKGHILDTVSLAAIQLDKMTEDGKSKLSSEKIKYMTSIHKKKYQKFVKLTQHYDILVSMLEKKLNEEMNKISTSSFDSMDYSTVRKSLPSLDQYHESTPPIPTKSTSKNYSGLIKLMNESKSSDNLKIPELNEIRHSTPNLIQDDTSIFTEPSENMDTYKHIQNKK
ncbi:hypothetical protein A3Q56_05194 [Intoshia linei]|uniref:Uncharacterized protein n=1 Tax=Intoshia linei TaxID=1819745 RepID=A0A177B0C4_9BILA|nr:hypothetical protein A3Q56_05194 [Intoshia linei]